jgi:hypothetical protein
MRSGEGNYLQYAVTPELLFLLFKFVVIFVMTREAVTHADDSDRT